MKEQILEALRSKEGYISGEAISKQLGCSRMAVWKHIEDLRSQGYRIESVHRKGYRLITELDLFDSKYILTALTTKDIGKELYFYPVLETTQIEAHQLAKEGKPHGTMVIADKQLKGKGRLGRQWESPAGSGIWTSLILRPNLPLQSASQFTLLISVAVARTLNHFGYEAQIKWPNDILLNGKKVCGILTELQADLDRIKYLIVGIGINIYQTEVDFPPTLSDLATSLYITDSSRTPQRNEIFIQLCREVEELYNLYLEVGFSPIKSLWESYALHWGQMIKVTTLQQTFLGCARGITEQGVLLVEDEAGKIHQIYSADITIKEE